MSRTKDFLTKIGNAGWLRIIIIAAVLVVGAYLTVKNWDSVVEGFKTLLEVQPSWLAFSVASVAFSLYAMAEVMRLLLRAGGVTAATRGNTSALTLASNAWAVTVPGGAAFSTGLQIKRMMEWGASAVLVSWFVLISGALSFLGLAFLGLGSFFFVGQGGTTAVLVAIAIVVLLATLLLWRLSQRPDVVRSVARWGLRVFNKIRKKPQDTDLDRLEDSLKQLTTVDLPLQTLVLSFTWSFINWVAEVVCLYAAIRSVGVDDISATKVLLAFVTGKLAGLIQATPGGIGTVEAALTAALVAGGSTGAEAFASVLVYRIVSFILVAIVGWIIYFLGFDHDERPARFTAGGEQASG